MLDLVLGTRMATVCPSCEGVNSFKEVKEHELQENGQCPAKAPPIPSKGL